MSIWQRILGMEETPKGCTCYTVDHGGTPIGMEGQDLCPVHRTPPPPEPMKPHVYRRIGRTIIVDDVEWPGILRDPRLSGDFLDYLVKLLNADAANNGAIRFEIPRRTRRYWRERLEKS